MSTSIESITDSANKVSTLMSSSSSSEQSLTDTTKKKLEALGLDTSNIQTETQGQQKLQEAQQSQSQQQNQGQSQNNNSSQTDLISEAKSLAGKVGASISDTDSIDDMISKLSTKISAIKTDAGEDNTKLQQAQQYQSELDSLQNQYTQSQQLQSMLAGSMNAMANANKISLGL